MLEDRRNGSGFGAGASLPSRDQVTEVAGVEIARLTEREVVIRLAEQLDRGIGGFVCTINLDHLRLIYRDVRFRAACTRANLRLADGMPLVWLSRREGSPLPERVTGADLLWSLSARARDDGRSIYLLGGPDGAADQAAASLVAAFPGLRVAGTDAPPFGFENDRVMREAVLDRLRAARPDFVFVALGAPRQEIFIAEHHDCVPSAWWLGIGAAIEFAAGRRRRAPRMVQRAGFEWLYRLSRDPIRLGRRYLGLDLPFLVRLITVGEGAMIG